MGKKRIIKKGASGKTAEGVGKTRSTSKLSKKKLENGILSIQSTHNNTKAMLSDLKGNAVAWSSSGILGFSGSRKGTPFAAAKVGEDIGDKAKILGTKEVNIVIKGVGSGRESCIRSFLAKSGSAINVIQDKTPIPFNGPRPRKARRV